jgi:Protein of unknown function (DUF3558)
MRGPNHLSIIVSTAVLLAALVSACGPKSVPTPSGITSRPSSAPTTAPTAATNSNPSGNNANGTSFDPCSFLTKDEASQVLGQPVTDVHVEYSINCFYDAANQLQVAVSAYPSGGVNLLKGSLQQFPDAQQVSGLGDEAIYTRDGRLQVRKGDAAFIIASTIPVTPDKLDKLKAAAVKIASRFLNAS